MSSLTKLRDRRLQQARKEEEQLEEQLDKELAQEELNFVLDGGTPSKTRRHDVEKELFIRAAEWRYSTGNPGLNLRGMIAIARGYDKAGLTRLKKHRDILTAKVVDRLNSSSLVDNRKLLGSCKQLLKRPELLLPLCLELSKELASAHYPTIVRELSGFIDGYKLVPDINQLKRKQRDIPAREPQSSSEASEAAQPQPKRLKTSKDICVANLGSATCQVPVLPSQDFPQHGILEVTGTFPPEHGALVYSDFNWPIVPTSSDIPLPSQPLWLPEDIELIVASQPSEPQPFGSLGNPMPSLSIPNVISDDAQSIMFAMTGNIEGLKSLFSCGQASVNDVSCSRRYGYVRWALYGGFHQHGTVNFLVQQGAPVDEESYEHVWDFLFRGKCNKTEEKELRCITHSKPGNWISKQKFPTIHQIILKLTPGSLEAELSKSPQAVVHTDAMGRTALDWATARAQLDDMKLLIAGKSPVNTMDRTGRTTIQHAIDSHSDEALRILLDAGANPNPIIPDGLCRSSPITSACFGGLANMIRMLIHAGADVHNRNPEGRGALGYPLCVQILRNEFPWTLYP